MTDTGRAASMQAAAIPRHYIDDSPLPEWGTADDGGRVRIDDDVELPGFFAAWRSQGCKHERQFTGKTINSGGVAVFKRYCVNCGIATTQHLPHRTIANTDIQPIDSVKRDKLIDQYVRSRRAALDNIANEAANRQQPQRRALYADYLSSPEWQRLRSSVMERCGGLCEGCRQGSADDVHHLTYRNIGNEFLFQLVGLCRACHTRWHEENGLTITDSGAAE